MTNYCSSTYICIVMYSQQEVSTNDNLKNTDETIKTKPHKEKSQTFGVNVKKNEKSKSDGSLEKKEKKKKVPKVQEHQNKEQVCIYVYYRFLIKCKDLISV